MNALAALPIRNGWYRGCLEWYRSMTSADAIWFVVVNGSLLGVLVLQRGSTLEGTALSLAAVSLPGVLGMMVGFGGLMEPMFPLVVEREDGTLLRHKAVPHGIEGYLISRLVAALISTAIGLLVIFGLGTWLVGGLVPTGADGWLGLAWVTALGLLATLPWGLIMGSVFTSPQAVGGMGMLATAGLATISGIFFPITQLWTWVQWIGQALPIYWIGLGMRSSFLPDAAAAVEIGGSWRTTQTVIVLGLWAVIGIALAPRVLRRMARRESGSSVQQRREKAMQRV